MYIFAFLQYLVLTAILIEPSLDLFISHILQEHLALEKNSMQPEVWLATAFD